MGELTFHRKILFVFLEFQKYGMQLVAKLDYFQHPAFPNGQANVK